MGRRPIRPDVPLGPPGPLEKSIHALRETRVPLGQIEPEVVRDVIGVQIAAMPEPRRIAMVRRLHRLEREYPWAQATFHSSGPKALARWAGLMMCGEFEEGDRCSDVALLRHKAIVLDGLGSLPRFREGVDARIQALEKRVGRLLGEMSRFRCQCERDHPAHTTCPKEDILCRWPTTPGALATRILAWYHREKAETMRRRLIKAAALMKQAELRSRLAGRGGRRPRP
jgi:hypothetical protein